MFRPKYIRIEAQEGQDPSQGEKALEKEKSPVEHCNGYEVFQWTQTKDVGL